MFTVKSATRALTDPKRIMEETRKILHAIDPEYPTQEAEFKEALQRIQDEMPQEKMEDVSEMLDLQEKAMAANLIFLIWKGLHQNLECFYQPVNKMFLKLDYEDIHGEEVMKSMPNLSQYWEKTNVFYRSLTREQQQLFDPVTSYYSYLQTAAWKLAHYFGFLIGDELLPDVVPGYQPDIALSISYGREIRDYLKVDTDKLIA